MKKIMMMVAIVATAVAAHAASWSWSAASGRLYDGNGTGTANRYAGTGYLFNSETVSQADILAAFAAGTLDASLGGALSTATFTSGRVNASDNFDGPNANFDAFFVVKGTDSVYISDFAASDYQSVGDSALSFGSQNTYSSAGFKDASAGYAGAGWYQAGQAAPEPTSGLLLLLGMAGLALKRKIA